MWSGERWGRRGKTVTAGRVDRKERCCRGRAEGLSIDGMELVSCRWHPAPSAEPSGGVAGSGLETLGWRLQAPPCYLSVVGRRAGFPPIRPLLIGQHGAGGLEGEGQAGGLSALASTMGLFLAVESMRSLS